MKELVNNITEERIIKEGSSMGEIHCENANCSYEGTSFTNIVKEKIIKNCNRCKFSWLNRCELLELSKN